MTDQTPIDLELSDTRSFEKLYEQVDKPLFFLKDASVASKNFNDWRKAGLWYDEGPEKRTWTKLNLEQYIWLKMIQQLRQMGCTTELILQVKEQLLTLFDLETLLPHYQAAALENLNKMPFEKEEKEAQIALIKSGEFIQALKETVEGQKLAAAQSQLRSLLFAALIKHQHAAVLVFPDGSIAQWLDEMHQMDPRTEKLFKRTHIYLSITEHLMAFLTDPDKESFIAPLQLLNSEEWQVLSALRDKTLKEITIFRVTDPKSRKISKTMITVKDGMVAEDDKEALLDILLNKKYQAIDFKRRSGNRLYFERESQKNL